ncbi:DUF222 domain-containing protein [bacterium RCC_150]
MASRRTAWSAEGVAAMDAVAASVAVLSVFTGADGHRGAGAAGVCACAGAAGDCDDARLCVDSVADADSLKDSDLLSDPGSAFDADPLRCLVDDCLDGLAEVARLEARTAALKAQLAVDFARASAAMAAPDASRGSVSAGSRVGSGGSVAAGLLGGYVERSVVAELACVLRVGERSAEALLGQARVLAEGLPLTRAALVAGEMSWQHARVMVEETVGMDAAGAAALEAHFLDPDAPDPARGAGPGELVPSRFRARARTWRERHHPVGIEERHARSVKDRRVEYCPDKDGMAWFSAYLPAPAVAGIWDRATAAARALQGPAEARTLTQLRADVTAAWLLAGETPPETAQTPAAAAVAAESYGPGALKSGVAGVLKSGVAGVPGARGLGAGVAGVFLGRVPSPRAQVLVTVPVLSLLGVGGEPAMLDGYGPVPASVARALVAEGAQSFHRVLTDPRDGAPLEIGRSSYRVPKAMRQWLRLRDGRCPFPVCTNHSLDNDADHLLAWADGGTTGVANLGQPCPKHHRLKHNTGWAPTGAGKDRPPGWVSPTGRYYPSEHQDWEPPHWPPRHPDTNAGGQEPEPPLHPDLPEDHFSDGPGWPALLDAYPEYTEPQAA